MKRSSAALTAAFLLATGSAAIAGSYVEYGAPVPVPADSYVVRGPGGIRFGFGPVYGNGPYGPAGYAPTLPCRYPDGWNAGDAAQELRGVPVGIDHECRVSRGGVVVDRDGRPTQ